MELCARWFLLALYVLFITYFRDVFAKDISTPEIVQVKVEGRLGSNATLSCVIRPPDVTVVWMFNDKPIVVDGTEYKSSVENITLSSDVDGNLLQGVLARLHIARATRAHHGRYGCRAGGGEGALALDLMLPARSAGGVPSPLRQQPSSTAIIYCIFEGFNLTEVKWRKDREMSMKFPAENQLTLQINETHVNGSLKIVDITRKDNGTYLCGVRDEGTNLMVIERVDLLVLEKPQISIDFMKAVGARKIYLNWTVNDGNSPTEGYSLQLRKNGTETWTYHSSPIDATSTQFVVADLDPSTPYQLKILARNSQGWGQAYADPRWIKTLETDPHFVPDIVVKGFTMSSVTVGWSPPPEPLAEYVHYYELLAREPGRPERADKEAVHSGNYRNLPYMFDNLTPDTSYIFRVRSCSELTRECGAWSPPVNGSTMDGAAGPPSTPALTCRHDPVSGVGLLYASWLPPVSPNGKVIRYNVELFSNASFLNAEGVVESLSWGPKIRHVPATARNTRFDNMPPNTNFTLKISAVTRTKRPGEPVTVWCSTPPSVPPRDSLQGFRWDKVREYDGRWLFRLYMPRVSERNGAICCYRVFLVRMKNEQRLADMPSPEHLTVSSYREVHNGKKGAGAYIAEIFTSNTLHSEVILGDGASLNAANLAPLQQCGRCAGLAPRPSPPPVPTAALTTTTEEVITEIVDVNEIEKQSAATVRTEPVTTTTPASTTLVPEEVAEVTTDAGEEEYSSTEKNESDKSRLVKKKKKIKRQFPTDETSKDNPPKQLPLQDLQDYQNTQPLSENDLNKQPMASYNDDRKFTLDDDFYINRRISHQNKPMPTTKDNDKHEKQIWNDDNEHKRDFDKNDYSREAIKSDDSVEFDEDDTVWTNNDEEDIEEFVMQPSKSNDIERKRRFFENDESGRYLGKHKIVARDVGSDHEDTDYSRLGLFPRHAVWKRQVEDSDNFAKLMKDLAREPNQGRIEFNERLKKLQEQKERDQTGGYVEEELIVLRDDGKGGLVEEDKEIKYSDRTDSGDMAQIFDGQLDIDSNYTGFVELLVHSEGTEWAPVYSNYFSVLNPGPDDVPLADNYLLEVVLKVICGCVGVALLLVLAVCAMHAHNRRKAPHHGVEMNTLQTTLRNIYQGLRGGRHQLVSHSPPDMPPIAKEDLLAAYNERQNDSGYGFQHEFESLYVFQMLPDCFPDRTMEASEAKENQGKNRYPDIKAYDQTRVRLSMVDGVQGSDYINANIVLGYKERKKFVCAQGPTDVTVDDFWRMIWEHNLELVVMLTNLEEYSKVKCAKYWPDQQHSEKVYGGSIHVLHQGEKRYSDYIIRELRISKQPLSTSNSQVIEANGVKKNGVGDMNNGNGNGTASGTSEERIVRQYHFLMWKDFVAPEHPHAILKFIKRVNEASSGGRTALVHCSAGVGRTGTLVALDCLLEQLQAEGHAAVFNTVCDLRRQRNFLVQSLKQYVFVYRALLEWATFGDTEIPASRLKSSVDRLRQTAENSDTCAMEEEFEKVKQPLVEMVKPCAAGRAPEHVAKNRSEAVLPYDHNRVILAPIPTKEHSTYINASFIEGYDNAESYIIAQDPMTSTMADFWRMVSEQEISTIVMLSELGEGKCPRYWDDEELLLDHISVSYLQSESCPYYTRREFQVTNTKNQERTRVTQLQYHGWPTVSGQVPEVTRGIIELVGQSGASPLAALPPSTPPLLVHCSLGTDRSSMFVALSILITQLRTERRVDVSTVTRKLRTQRMGCLDTFLQYEFLHRAIVNYAELHNLLSDS